MSKHLDEIDLKILSEIQADGRITNVELAKRVGISPPPCLRRVRTLEEDGYIQGYRGLLDPRRLGFDVTVFASVHLSSQADADLRAFEEFVRVDPVVGECWMLSGEVDFILKCVAPDMATFQEFVTHLTTEAAKTVRSDSYLTLHYRITTLEGEQFLSTFDMSPASLQMGSGQLAENLESCLVGLPAHERFVFQLEPEEAFGVHNPRLVERIARSALPADMELKENSVVEFGAPNGATFAGFLRELTADSALFDFNHPMAGKPIRFEVEIIGIM